MRPSSVVFPCAALFALGGCFVESPTSLTDTQGVQVGWTCDGGDCEVDPIRATVAPPVCGDRDRWVLGAGAVAVLCGASLQSGELVVHEATCRPLACTDELDCPQWEDLVYGCDGGVCTTDRLKLDPLDVRAACLMRVPRAASCAESERDELTARMSALAESACADPRDCEIPEACRQ